MLDLLFPFLILITTTSICAFAVYKRERSTAPAAPQLTPDQGLAELHKQLEQARKRAAEAHRGRALALTRLSHELRTPLNGMLGFTELLLAGDLEGEARQQAQLISESGRSALRLVNDVLDLAKLESGSFRLVEEDTDLRGEMQNCVDMMQPAARLSGVALKANLDPALPARLTFDSLRLREIVLGLLGNAIKFAGPGMVILDARCIDNRLQLSVIDNGPGIAADLRSKIFEPFFCAQDSDASRSSASNLGLAIARQTVRAMGGELTLHCDEGTGCTFTISVPVKTAFEQEAAETPALDAAGDDLRVLVAEDNPINQHLILSMLEKLGITATLVSNGEEVLVEVDRATIQGCPFDLILMDVQMPELDGIETTRHLRQSGYGEEQLRILALTANCFPEDIEACHEAGMQGHIAKPVSLAALSQAISRLSSSEDVETEDAPVSDIPIETPNNLAIAPYLRDASDAVEILQQKYCARKQELFALIEQLLSEDADKSDWAVLQRELHKLSGIAANFGEARLGEVSREVSKSITTQQDDTAKRNALSRGVEELREAA